mmetsp:Transcript_4592/g.7044  ORF Transcript_4592/g.7044 Transcript_4592/m.7044 type:complete len:254 (-) Transcript_4592:3467-4228(-)
MHSDAMTSPQAMRIRSLVAGRRNSKYPPSLPRAAVMASLMAKKDTASKEKRRLSHCLATMHCKWVVSIFQQGDIERFRHIVERWDFVRSWSSGVHSCSWANPSVIVVTVDNFFDCSPAHTLNKRSFDLPYVYRRIDTRTNIDQHVSRYRFVIPSQGIYFNLRHGNTLSKIIKRMTLPSIIRQISWESFGAIFVPIVTTTIIIKSKESVCAQVNSLKEGLLGNFLQGSIRRKSVFDWLNALQYLLTRIKRRHSV